MGKSVLGDYGCTESAHRGARALVQRSFGVSYPGAPDMGDGDQPDFGPMPPDLTIIIVEKDRDRALRIVDALTEAGDYRITVLSDEGSLARRNADRRPDVVLIDVASPREMCWKS